MPYDNERGDIERYELDPSARAKRKQRVDPPPNIMNYTLPPKDLPIETPWS